MSVSASIIVPTHNKRSRLELTLQSFNLQDVTDFEVVVCDDGSSDGTAGMLSGLDCSYQIRVVSGVHRGAAAARNRAAVAAKGQILIFNDDDMVPAPGFVAAHLTACDAEDILSRGERWSLPISQVDGFLNQAFTEVLYQGIWRGARMTAAEGWARDSLTSNPQHNYRFLQSCTSNLAMRASTFAQVGAFHEAFGTGWGAEDTEFGYRAQQHGVDIRLTRQAMNLHLEHSADSGAKFRRGLENFRIFKDLYPGRKDIATLFTYLELAISEGHASEIFDEQTFIKRKAPSVAKGINACIQDNNRSKASYMRALRHDSAGRSQ